MNFVEYKYKDIGKIRSGKRLKKGYVVSNTKSNNRYIRVRDIYNGMINEKDVQYITDEAASSIKKYRVYTNDLIISVVGTVGAIATIPEALNGAYLTENCDNLLVDEKICLKEYLKYYLMSSEGQNEINSHIVGTTQPKLPIYGIEAFNIKVPSIEIQSKIIKLLNILNKKILLNTYTNNNLQELLLYKYNSYFQGKNANGKLKEIVLKTNRTIKKDKINKSLKYYPIDVLPKNNIILQDGKSIEEAQSSLIEFNKNEILVGAMRVYFHRVCLTNNSGITRNTTFVLKPKDEDYLYYSLLTLYQESFINYANITSKGTTMPYAVWENVCSEFDIYIPTKEELEEFNIVCKAIINKMNINQAENQKLEQIRDTLLPKLMNGEIDLDKIEI